MIFNNLLITLFVAYYCCQQIVFAGHSAHYDSNSLDIQKLAEAPSPIKEYFAHGGGSLENSSKFTNSLDTHKLADAPPSPPSPVKAYFANGSLLENGSLEKTLPKSSNNYRTIEKGSLHTLNYRIFFEGPTGELISPWHDIPLYASEKDKVFNMVVEIPRGSNAKMEMSTKEPMSPIRQDANKNGMPRFVANIFPYKGYPWNYGALPQTWEDPHHVDARTEAMGDNDPIDVVEIGTKVHKSGAVIQVKVLGILAMLDEGETDWKLIAIDVNDSMASQIESIEDIEQHKPGLLDATYEWLRDYKISAGKPPNKFAFDGKFQNQTLAHKIIEETHQFWKALISRPNSLQLNTECHAKEALFPASKSNWNKLLADQPEHGPAQPMPDYV